MATTPMPGVSVFGDAASEDQGVVWKWAQVPVAPSQIRLAHALLCAHLSPGASLQEPVLSQTRVFMQFGASSVPAGTIEHVPSDPSTLQARQDPVQAVSQQTPSTQYPRVGQSEGAEHGAPSSGPHRPDALHT